MDKWRADRRPVEDEMSHSWLYRMKRRVKQALPHRQSVETSWISRIFGATLLRKELWSFRTEQLARGLALGLFVAFTPTMGFQMLIVCCLILLFPGNLPVALAACWLTNPFTAAPVYFFEYKLGKWLVQLMGSGQYHPHVGAKPFSQIYEAAGVMWLGSLVAGLVIGAIGYLLALALVGAERKIRLKEILRLRGSRPEGGSADNGKKTDMPDNSR